MNFLLDTNVVSEWVRPLPDPGVVRWLAGVDEDQVYLSVVTLAELRHGISRMPRGGRRRRLEKWLGDDLMSRFGPRILEIDRVIALAWGDIVAERYDWGRPIGAMDAFIAATARVHDLDLVTRNDTDFTGSVGRIVNPWSATLGAN